ncbi:STAS domain-containing protein [[Kitasatospora] papulosa]|uniref:STAS domain-containing protein n=1 Tax=[Kitasatospora] papulosa TaxID=1464011 RepID=UPI003699E834
MVISTRYPSPRAFVVALWGSAGPDASERLEAVFREAVASGDPVIVDLAGLAFCDAHLLGHLLAVRLRRTLILVGPLSDQVKRRFAVTGTTKALKVQPGLTAALAHLAL